MDYRYAKDIYIKEQEILYQKVRLNNLDNASNEHDNEYTPNSFLEQLAHHEDEPMDPLELRRVVLPIRHRMPSIIGEYNLPIVEVTYDYIKVLGLTCEGKIVMPFPITDNFMIYDMNGEYITMDEVDISKIERSTIKLKLN